MPSHSHHLVHIARETQELVEHLIAAILARNYNEMTLDLTKLQANTAEITRIAQAAQAGDSADVQAAVLAAQESDQAQADAALADQSTALATLTAEFPPKVAVPLAVSPTSISSAPGAAISQALTVSGGTAPYTFVSSLADVAVDGSGNVSGSPAAAETGTITVTDSTTAQATVTVTIA